ncbi:hypothetical protein ES705_46042 [subsurface metagenome]
MRIHLFGVWNEQLPGIFVPFPLPQPIDQRIFTVFHQISKVVAFYRVLKVSAFLKDPLIILTAVKTLIEVCFQ